MGGYCFIVFRFEFLFIFLYRIILIVLPGRDRCGIKVNVKVGFRFGFRCGYVRYVHTYSYHMLS